MGKEDVERYIEFDIPDMGIVSNQPTALRCHNDECEQSVSVDPDTLIVEDENGCVIESEQYDTITGEPTGVVTVEIFCSPSCRNDHYAGGIAEAKQVSQ
mgnify:CR=1 FL=1